uniref:hypothetical protein n=1 Tax=Arthrobacter sp. ERGS1:01 TaxID=1704044 RepID=UPI001ED9ABC2|nr:hypothetical protein [Arthrobacter sp. ERGS1:01]
MTNTSATAIRVGFPLARRTSPVSSAITTSFASTIRVMVSVGLPMKAGFSISLS